MREVHSLRWRVAQFLELRWWKRYLSGQSPQEYLQRKRAYWQRLLGQLDWRVDPGARVLDAGCGPAGIFILLHDRQRITALDPLLDRYGELAIFDRSHYPGVRFLSLPIEEGGGLDPFDCIYCMNAINHVADWERSLDTLTRLSRPGTRMVLSSDVHRHGILWEIFRRLPGDVLHPQQHRAVDYRRALEAKGWRIERELTLRREFIFDYRAWVCERSGADVSSVDKRP